MVGVVEISTDSLKPRPTSEPALRVRMWDARNTSSLVIAAGFRRKGWAVDWLTEPGSLIQDDVPVGRDTRSVLEKSEADALALVLFSPVHALTLHGDDQVRFLLSRWASCTPLHRFLPDRDALEIALSKQRSMEIARRLGVPVLSTELVDSAPAAARAAAALAPGGFVVLKGEGGSAGSTVRRLRAGETPAEDVWSALTRRGRTVMVQRAIDGPKVLVTVVFERGRERAAVAHEKVVAWPPAFGITAAGVTRRVAEAHAYAERIFSTLAWQGIANLELRQDRMDGRWYFMEINPRVPSSVGIQEAAGVDLAATWAAICEGNGAVDPPGRGYREGVRFTWGVPGCAVALRAPWTLPAWAVMSLLRGGDDLREATRAVRRQARRLSLWNARNENA